MEYHGKLYGKIGNKYFDTSRTSKDFDEMLEFIQSLINESEDIVHSEVKKQAEQLIKKLTL